MPNDRDESRACRRLSLELYRSRVPSSDLLDDRRTIRVIDVEGYRIKGLVRWRAQCVTGPPVRRTRRP